MEKKTALKIWDDIYGENRKWVTDCFGIYMYRDDYGDTETTRIRPGGDGKRHFYGWEIDHIRPKDDFVDENDANFYNNYEPMHWMNNREKKNDYPYFYIDKKQYNVVECDICKCHGLKGYGIKDKNNKRIDWKGVQKKYYAE